MKILVDGMSREKGGIGSLLLNFAIYSKQVPAEDAIQFDFLLPENSEYQGPLEKLGCKYYIVPSITNVFSYQSVIKTVFEKNQYDYLWLNNTSKVNRFLPVCAVKNGAWLITHPHGVDDEEQGIKKKIFRILNRINHSTYMRLMSIPFACSAEAARCYYQNDEILQNTTIIKNGIFVDRFAFSGSSRKAVRQQLAVQDGIVLIGTVGRLSAVKNHGFLVQLFASLPENYCCVILGDGEERENLARMIGELGMTGRFLLPGQVENVHEYLSAFDIFVMPSLHEGMPYAAIEAQASGLPCVVSHTVSGEVKLSDLVRFAELNREEDWKKKILEIRPQTGERERYAGVIKKSGYSIEECYSIFQKAVAAKE